MRIFASVLLVACHASRPIEMPRPLVAPAMVSQDDLGVAFSGNPRTPSEPNVCIPETDTYVPCEDRFFELVDSPVSTFAGRYYVDGIYRESRGPSYPLWHGFGGR